MSLRAKRAVYVDCIAPTDLKDWDSARRFVYRPALPQPASNPRERFGLLRFVFICVAHEFDAMRSKFR